MKFATISVLLVLAAVPCHTEPAQHFFYGKQSPRQFFQEEMSTAKRKNKDPEPKPEKANQELQTEQPGLVELALEALRKQVKEQQIKDAITTNKTQEDSHKEPKQVQASARGFVDDDGTKVTVLGNKRTWYDGMSGSLNRLCPILSGFLNFFGLLFKPCLNILQMLFNNTIGLLFRKAKKCVSRKVGSFVSNTVGKVVSNGLGGVGGLIKQGLCNTNVGKIAEGARNIFNLHKRSVRETMTVLVESASSSPMFSGLKAIIKAIISLSEGFTERFPGLIPQLKRIKGIIELSFFMGEGSLKYGAYLLTRRRPVFGKILEICFLIWDIVKRPLVGTLKFVTKPLRNTFEIARQFGKGIFREAVTR